MKVNGFTGLLDFVRTSINVPYLDESDLFYAPKLAAAVNAWGAVTRNESLRTGKTPKQALEKWLRQNAHQYGLTKEGGNPNETGIEEICKIANWRPEAGAAKTPSAPASTANRKIDMRNSAYDKKAV